MLQGIALDPPNPPISWGAKSLTKSPNLSGDNGGSILGKLQNLRSIGVRSAKA